MSKKGKKKVKNESVLVPAVKWAINTTGCRHRPFLAAFQDSKIFFDNPNPDCDNCMMKHLINTGDLNNPPTVLGIPLAITLAYLPYLPQNSAVPNKTLKTRGPPVNEERLNLLVADLQDWRQHITPTESYLHPTMILGNEAIEMIRKHIREITTEENLKEVLGKCGSRGRSGHRFPQSLLTPHLSGLFAAVLESIASSVHLQPKSRKSTVHRPKSALLRPATLPRPIPKPACLERFLPEIRIPMPSYRPVFNAAALSLPTASIAASRSPLADIQPNSLPRNSIGNVPNLLPHPPKSLGDKNEDTDDIVSIISTISRFTIKLPMKRIRENDPGWFEDYESRRTSRC
ncbi:MAG: hypothetical protein E6J34_21630 [Chloroflexi bacterium]|nr:MAG: hypothetical protein E6J34_21630 [Chloroflexota bacterium]